MITKSLEREKKLKINNQKGITLMALVITIIVLLILSTVTIYNMTNDDSSIIASVETQRDDMLKMNAKQTIEVEAEKIKIKHVSDKGFTIDRFIKELNDELQKNDVNANVVISNNSNEMYDATYNGYTFSYYFNDENNFNLKVNYYLENANDNNYTLVNTKTHLLEYADTIIASDYDIEIENGTYEYASLIASESGAESSKIESTKMGTETTIYLYYSRDLYEVKLNAGESIESVSGAGTYKVGQSVKISAILGSADGYEIKFNKWSGTFTTNDNPYTFEMPANDVELTANTTKNVNKYTVTCIDKVDSTSGTELGRTTWLEDYGTTAYGSTAGSSTTTGAYYSKYYYSSCTNAKVTTNGCTVYRIFKLKDYTVYFSTLDGKYAYGKIGTSSISNGGLSFETEWGNDGILDQGLIYTATIPANTYIETSWQFTGTSDPWVSTNINIGLQGHCSGTGSDTTYSGSSEKNITLTFKSTAYGTAGRWF